MIEFARSADKSAFCTANRLESETRNILQQSKESFGKIKVTVLVNFGESV